MSKEAIRYLSCCKTSREQPDQYEQFVKIEEDYLEKFDEIVVIGDVHGCNVEFEEALSKIHSETPTKKPDRVLKILVGDLVNKGPDSKRVLEICIEKYSSSILSVKGNHDELAIQLYDELQSNKANYLKSDQLWLRSIPKNYVSYLRSLPYTITIPSLKSIIVHAGLQPFIDEPASMTPKYMMCRMRNIVVTKGDNSEEFVYKPTKNHLEGAAWATFWPGPEHVYFGHDARRRLQNDHEFATGLDTGCAYGDRLSYIYLKGSRTGEICSIKARKQYQLYDKDL